MERNTHLANSIEMAAYRSQYDAEAKGVVADKQVLARIMKHSAKEFKNYEINQIIDCIEGTPEISTKPIYPGMSTKEKITGLATESNIPNEGKVTYDIRFYAVAPDKKRIRIYLNVEVQKAYYVGYHFVPRGIFYCARMISEQLDTEFTTDDYDEIKKVYSIWICIETPKTVANTITEYHMCEDDIFGVFEGNEPYDLLSVIMVRLSGQSTAQAGNELIDMLSVLLSPDLDAEKKKEELKEKYNMKMTEKMEGGIDAMCNLGEWVMEKAWEKGMAQGMAEGMAQGMAEGMAQGMAQGMAEGMAQGMNQGIAMERCNVVCNLYKTMSVDAIVTEWKYDKAFVMEVVHLLDENPELSSKEIVEMLTTI